jgi:signal transduction histidine kinase
MLRSFRSRLLFGSILGALGILAISHLLSIAMIHHYPVTIHLRSGSLLLVTALICIIAGLLQVRRGLSPFDDLRSRLAAVRDGRSRLLEGSYPTEVEPLVSDLNALLEHRERIVKRALATAGDLAHGLKTPLAILTQEAEHAREAGHGELAAAITQQIERMRRQVDYHLAHARAAASGATPGSHCMLFDSVEGLKRTLLRLHADRGLIIDVDIRPEHSVRVQREDLDEMIGNLLDNACKWARSHARIQSSELESMLVIVVEDDGPGLEPSMREQVLLRGVRGDETAPGWGLGLAIVRDLAALYGGSIALDNSKAGGLRATLRLPAG